MGKMVSGNLYKCVLAPQIDFLPASANLGWLGGQWLHSPATGPASATHIP
jgi:hypothetical protein